MKPDLPGLSRAIFAGFLFLLAHAALAGPQGLLIYAETANFPEACEFSSIKPGPLYSQVERADGTTLKILATATMRPVDYPPSDLQLLQEPVAEWNLAEIETLQREFPSFSKRLAAIATRWKNALAVAKLTSRPKSDTSADDRYAAMPRDAFVRFGEENPPPTRAAPRPLEKPDPFANFGGNALDRRQGFIGSHGVLEPNTVISVSAPTDVAPAEESPKTTPDENPKTPAEWQAYLEKLLAE